jgi:small subunit ribosomal protein S8
LSYLFSGICLKRGNTRSKEIKLVMTDPIADMLTRIRNAQAAGHDFTLLPLSNIKLSLARIMKEEGLIQNFDIVRGRGGQVIKLWLRYTPDRKPFILGLKRVSRPGLRIYAKRGEIPRVCGGLGITILSTSQGLMTGKEAWRKNLGGELLCYVW